MIFAAQSGCFVVDQLLLSWPSKHLTICKINEYLNKNKNKIVFSRFEDCHPIITILKDDFPIVNRILAVGKWIIATTTTGEVVSIERDDRNVLKVISRSIVVLGDDDVIVSVAIDINANLIIIIIPLICF